MGERLSRSEVIRVANRWIGVASGYLGDFSYRSHEDFYPEFCNIDDIDPNEISGTTRERFISILESQSAERQAFILRGVLERFPPGSTPPRASNADRNEGAAKWVERLIERLETDGGAGEVEAPLEPPATISPSSEAVARTESRAIRIASIRVVERIAQEIADKSANAGEAAMAEMILSAMDALREYVGESPPSTRLSAWLNLLTRAAAVLKDEVGELADLADAILDVLANYGFVG